MSTPSAWAFILCASAAVLGCHDSPPPAEPRSDQPEKTRINEVHSDVKENLHEAADKTRKAAEKVQTEIQKGAGKVGTELGVRREVKGRPEGADGGTR